MDAHTCLWGCKSNQFRHQLSKTVQMNDFCRFISGYQNGFFYHGTENRLM